MRKSILLFVCFGLAGCGSDAMKCTGPAPLCNNGSPLQSIAVSSSATTLSIGATMQFSATGHYHNGSTVDITDGVLWSTDAPEIALVGITGVALGENPGAANIGAAAGSITSFEAITVAP